eukprot:m.336653 g.336653  ORF g.336653 m.336653 type:complete len:74 (-) comp55703_c0_seq8:2038-2259(-)
MRRRRSASRVQLQFREEELAERTSVHRSDVRTEKHTEKKLMLTCLIPHCSLMLMAIFACRLLVQCRPPTKVRR